jgi:putative alpha-1,2-mannosidase
MTEEYTCVDPWIGTEPCDVEGFEGLASRWIYLKAQIGNTHPGAVLPFSAMSVCPYSGGYPTGYGRYDVNTWGRPGELFDRKRIYGITHLHHTGTGFIDSFYNFLLVLAWPRDAAAAAPALPLRNTVPATLVDESARPGYYSGRIAEHGIGFELTAGKHTAIHRYTNAGSIVLDVTNGGLLPDRCAARPASVSVTAAGATVEGWFEHHGVRWFFAARLTAKERPVEPALWHGAARPLPGGFNEVRRLPAATISLGAEECRSDRAGAVWEAKGGAGGGALELVVSLSLDSVAAARRRAEAAGDGGFDAAAEAATTQWCEHLGRIRVEGGNEADRRKLYTGLYHSILKPSVNEGSNHLWRHGPPLYAGLATLWDLYKTQLPLVFTLFPEHIEAFIESMLALREAIGTLPPAVIFDTDLTRFTNQSRLLPVLVMSDGLDHLYARGSDPRKRIGELESRFLDTAVAEVVAHAAALDAKSAVDEQYHSHLLDLSQAARCVERRLRARSTPVPSEVSSAALAWRLAIDPGTGLLYDGTYYEGGAAHYSFRSLADMESRIAVAGGKARFVDLLDDFFGFGAESVAQLTGTEPHQRYRDAIAVGRFDGCNNEICLDAPYCYAAADAPDRLETVLEAVRSGHFSDKPGGLPGNDDTGALSSWLVWAEIGLFPLPGNTKFVNTEPVFDRVAIEAGGRTIRIDRGDKSRPSGSFVSYESLFS